ncbi:MAG TPA: YidC/Oxa1 family membrane protein insertase [Thermomicrobiales bacterium]|nr:YidC/Oxa1 family membrane protein insertase [Thermomicrobiales bacterium]
MLTVLLALPTVPGWDIYLKVIETGLVYLANFTHNPGVAIIIFTLLIKIALTPLTVKSLRSSRAMQDLQPKIKALQKRMGNDRQKLSAETMRLYQEHKVNPMAGCLPMVIQIPIFWGFYEAIRVLSRQGQGEFAHGFLWIHSLAHADPYHVLPIVAFVFQLIQTRMSLPEAKNRPTDPQQKMMTQMMQFMPVTVLLFGWAFDSGPVIYWVTQSAFSAVQQYFITGWGSLRDWLPFLPEVTRYTPPTHTEEDDKVVVSSSEDDRPAPTGGGLWGLINRQLQRVEAQQHLMASKGDEGEKAAAKDEPRQRIIVTDSTRADRPGKAGKGTAKTAGTAGTAGAAGANGAADDEDEPPRPARSRIIYEDGAGAKPGRGAKPAAPDGANGARGAGEGEAAPGPVVPRRNRNRR